MRALLRKFRKYRRQYRHLVEVHIHKEHILHNLKQFGDGVAPVLKSNAYGHGLLLVAEILNDQKDIPFIIVDSYYEALLLRSYDITLPLLVLGYTFPENIATSKLKNVSYGITSLTQLREVARLLERSQTFHIKVDTGMHRQGVLPSELEEVRKIVQSNDNIVVEGLCSHLADADGESGEFTKKQGSVWNEVRGKWKGRFPETHHYHLANTAGTHIAENYGTNVSRVGIGLYGFDMTPRSNLDLKPALEMKTIITGVKQLKKGERVGYNVTFEAERDMTIATIPVGYFEGVDRRLSNKGVVYVDGVVCPIVGRVSMNITTIDVSNVEDAKEGDTVEVIGTDVSRENTAGKMAEMCGTIPYDILVHVPSVLRRIVV